MGREMTGIIQICSLLMPIQFILQKTLYQFVLVSAYMRDKILTVNLPSVSLLREMLTKTKYNRRPIVFNNKTKVGSDRRAIFWFL